MFDATKPSHFLAPDYLPSVGARVSATEHACEGRGAKAGNDGGQS